MSKRTFNLIVGITGAVAAGASAVVVFLAPPAAPAIVASIGIVETAVTEICSKFLKA